MKDKIHLFHVGNYFHLVSAQSIIASRQLSKESLYFCTYRGFMLPSLYADRLLFDKDETGPEAILAERERYERLLEGKDVCMYCTFQYSFPMVRYFREYVFFEDGASVIGAKHKIAFDKWDILREIKFHLRLLRKLGLGRSNLKGLCHGAMFFSPVPVKSTLYRLTDGAYKGFHAAGCKVETVSISAPPIINTRIHDAVIVVVERLVDRGRPYDLDAYMTMLKEFLESYDMGGKAVYLKLHPADYDNPDAQPIVREYLSFLDYEIISYGLEDIALSDLRNTFIGANSTILYYAPIFGKSNRSVSFARLFAERHEQYAAFLKRWGGMGKFEKYVEVV